ncbi:hypothetical protein Ancab_039659 [Ancistrocladus abbreviatus]
MLFCGCFNPALMCMKGRPPDSVISGQDKAMQEAIQKVFPNARHRWCLWKIMRKLPEKLGGHGEYEYIKLALENAVYDSFTSDEFEENWSKMMEKFGFQNNEWLSVLYNERRYWVPVYLEDTFWAGMPIGCCGESLRSIFDDYVGFETTAMQFLPQYENVTRRMVELENREDFSCLNSYVPCLTHCDMGRQLQEAYTQNVQRMSSRVDAKNLLLSGTCQGNRCSLQL